MNLETVKIVETVSGCFPTKAYESDAAYDLYAAEDMPPPRWGNGAIVDIPVGFRIELPPWIAGLILPRSSTSMKYGLWIPNSPGLIDPGFRGDVKVRTRTLDINDWPVIHKGDRIAQLLFTPIARVLLDRAEELRISDRGTRGWGSTG